jgi:hypothetical protein
MDENQHHPNGHGHEPALRAGEAAQQLRSKYLDLRNRAV